jgi:hypothetical protein
MLAWPATSVECMSAPVPSGGGPGPSPVARCQQQLRAFEAALMATNPPEIVGVTIASTLSSLAEVASWSPERIAERAALEARLLAAIAALAGEISGAAGAAVFCQCVLTLYLATREGAPAAAR